MPFEIKIAEIINTIVNIKEPVQIKTEAAKNQIQSYQNPEIKSNNITQLTR